MGKKNGERGMGDGERGMGKEKWEWRISKRDDFVNSTKGKWGMGNGERGNGKWGSSKWGKGEKE